MSALKFHETAEFTIGEPYHPDRVAVVVYDGDKAVSLTAHNAIHADGSRPEVLMTTETLKLVVEKLRELGVEI